MKFRKGKTFALDQSKDKNNDNVVISSEYYENDRPSYLCSICNCTLSCRMQAGITQCISVQGVPLNLTPNLRI